MARIDPVTLVVVQNGLKHTIFGSAPRAKAGKESSVIGC